MAMTYTPKKVSATEIKVDLTKNVRLAQDFEVAGRKVDTYDLGSMIEAIIVKRGIVEPVKVNKDLYVLQGFRRILAAKAILVDPERYIPDFALRSELLESLKRVPALVYSSLTADEELDVINDHGDRKGIGRLELLRTVWKFYVGGHSEASIAQKLYYALAEYTGNTKLLNTLPAIGTPERAKRLQKWFHGTLGNKMLKAYNMGPRVQKAYLLTEMGNDNLIPKNADGVPEVKPEFKVKGDRIGKLSGAVTQDKEKGTWDEENFSGVTFNSMIETFIKEDATGVTTPVDPRMTLKDMEDRRRGYQSSAFKAALNIASGNPVDNAQELDMQAARAEANFGLIRDNLDRIANPELKDVLSRVVYADPTDFQKFLLDQCVAVTEVAPTGVEQAV